MLLLLVLGRNQILVDFSTHYRTESDSNINRDNVKFIDPNILLFILRFLPSSYLVLFGRILHRLAPCALIHPLLLSWLLVVYVVGPTLVHKNQISLVMLK